MSELVIRTEFHTVYKALFSVLDGINAPFAKAEITEFPEEDTLEDLPEGDPDEDDPAKIFPDKDHEGGSSSAEAPTGSPMERASLVLDRYGNSVLRMAYSYLHNRSDAEDILQDVLIQYIKAAPAFESGEHEKAWLLRVAANLSKNKIKYNKIRETDELMEELVAEKKEDLSFVWEAVKMLPEKYAEVVHLFYAEGLSTKEIAKILGRKEATVRSDLLRGRERLKNILKEAYDFE